jgi:hypothetical protein
MERNYRAGCLPLPQKTVAVGGRAGQNALHHHHAN